MKTTMMKTLFPACMLLCLSAIQLHAQVTIGSGIEPLKGALLDLKEEQKDDGTANSTRGLLLPRVNLTDPADITAGDISGVNASNKDAHTGLTVYNLNKCFAVTPGKGGTGVYVWSGTEWQYLGEANDIEIASLGLSSSLYGTADVDGNLRVDIPSGLDARGTTISPFSLTVNSNPLASLGTMTNAYNGSVIFDPAQISTIGALAANPTLYSNLQATDMTIGADAVTADNPWKTRQTVLPFSGQAGCPPVAISRSVTLNQTNYAILAYNNVSPNTIEIASNFIALRNTNSNIFRIKSNVAWKAAVTDDKDILDHNIPATGGADNSEGDSPQSNHTLTGRNTPDTKYETATILLEDNTTPKRAKDYPVTVMQCLGTEDMSSVPTVTDNNDPDWQAAWGTDVVRHPAKADPNDNSKNIYEEFYSAGFGAAGRWMTTNLAAWKYDGNKHSQSDGDDTNGETGRTLTGPSANSASVYNVAYWCYPNGGSGGSNATSFTNNPHTGLLYTWDAATAGKGGSTGQGNATNEGASAAYPRVQGVCPAGWHLPSDREWTELENEIIRSTTNYANVSSDISPDGSAGLLPFDGTGQRGSSHGQAMKEVCGVNGTEPNGLSNSLSGNGFSVLLAGRAYNGGAYNFGNYAYFWSSSSNSGNNAWYRTLSRNSATVYRDYSNPIFRHHLFLVRCKKD
jgi:uncharacterized protein (TIGR02145 family)